MNKFMLAMAAICFGTAAAYAETVQQVRLTPMDHGSATLQQQQARASHESGIYTWGAYARNIGPGSTVSGTPEDSKGGANSGNDEIPGAPTASSRDN